MPHHHHNPHPHCTPASKLHPPTPAPPPSHHTQPSPRYVNPFNRHPPQPFLPSPPLPPCCPDAPCLQRGFTTYNDPAITVCRASPASPDSSPLVPLVAGVLFISFLMWQIIISTSHRLCTNTGRRHTALSDAPETHQIYR